MSDTRIQPIELSEEEAGIVYNLMLERLDRNGFTKEEMSLFNAICNWFGLENPLNE